MFKLKVVKNENGVEILDKKKVGNDYIFLAMNEQRKVSEVNKAWVLKNQANIVNLGVSADGKLYAVKADRATCEVCGKKHSFSALLPVYEGKGDEAVKSARMICKGCLAEENGKDYVQCGDCKRVFDTGIYGYKPESPRGFKVYEASNGQVGTIEHLCSECEGKKYSVCTGCENVEYGQCIIKTSDFSKKVNYGDCYKGCVDMVKEARASLAEQNPHR